MCYDLLMRNATHPEITTAAIVRLYRNGQSLNDIANSVGLTAGAILYRLKRAGIARRPKGRHGLPPTNTLNLPLAKVIAMYEAGQSAYQIARTLSCAAKTICDRLHRAGVVARTRRDYPSPSGSANPNWRGGRFTDESGYVKVRRSKCYAFEHRLIMEHVLERPLKSSEHVHHMNGIRDDNRPENLVALDARAHKREGWTLVKALQQRVRELEATHSEKPRT